MKHITTILIVLFASLITSADAQINEIEPNDSIHFAQDVLLNEDIVGGICMWNSEDWYTVVLPEDGKLTITSTVAGEGTNPFGSFRFQLFSGLNEGYFEFIPEIGENNMMVTDTYSYCCLLADTVYLKVFTNYVYPYCYDYSFVLDLEPATFSPDSEPNSTVTNDLTIIPYNTPMDGHLSFINHPQFMGKDDYDYYKIISPTNGVMRLHVQSEAQNTGSNNLKVMLHQSNGNPWYMQPASIGEFQTPSDDTLYWDCFPNDTLILLVYTDNYYDLGYSYRIQYDVVAPIYSNDVEPNNSFETAQVIAINEPTYGQAQFYTDNSDDYFQLVKPDTGYFKLFVTSSTNSSDGTAGTKIQFFNSNFNLLYQLNAPLGTNGLLASDSLVLNNIPAGTYYIKVYSDYAYAACRSYQLTFDYFDIADGVSEHGTSQLAIYPNPTNGLLNIPTQHLTGTGSITIINPLGKVMSTNKISFGKSETIDMQSFPSGVYFVVTKGAHFEFINRIVKN